MLAATTRLSIVLVLIGALVLLAGAPAWAQESPVQVLVGVTPSASYSDTQGFDLNQGLSVGVGYFVAPRWAAELRGTIERYGRSSVGEDSHAYTLDLASHYYFLRKPKWSLFSAAGLRYAESDLGRLDIQENATGLLVGLGAEYSLTRRFSLRFDATDVPVELGGAEDRLLGGSLALGLGFRF